MKCVTGILIITILSPLCLAAPRPVTREDIKDAILSLVRMFRDLTDKLERHEYRERNLGEQLKKALSSLDRRGRGQDVVLENVVATLGKLDGRLQKIENSLSMTEREKGSYTVDADPLQLWMTNMEGILQQSHSKEQYINQDQLKGLEASVNSRLDSISSNMEKLEAVVLQATPAPSLLTQEKIFDRIESQLALQGNWHNAVLSALETHEKIISDLQKSHDNEGLTELTKEVESMKQELISNFETEMKNLEKSMMQLHKMLNQGQENIMKTMTDNNDMAVGFYEVVQKSYDQLSTDIKALGKVEKVLIQTADNVMDSKRRFEYGVQQILVEVGDLIKLQGKDINTTMNKRFDGISETILDNQNGGLTNLSSKIETEISQVWRQIGIMYQQLTASAGALDVLQRQTETYVNGSLQTMDSMEGKVGQITARMTEVDENLNYLLGRFSLVTQEFNQIKTALATALDNIKSSFHSVQQKIKEVGPGPNPIENSNSASDVDNIL